MNAAAVSTIITVFGCGGIAGLVAITGDAGWFTLVFILAGLAVGWGFGYLVHRLACRLLEACPAKSGALVGWGMLGLYIFVPFIIAVGGIGITGWSAFLVLRYVF